MFLPGVVSIHGTLNVFQVRYVALHRYLVSQQPLLEVEVTPFSTAVYGNLNRTLIPSIQCPRRRAVLKSSTLFRANCSPVLGTNQSDSRYFLDKPVKF